MERNSVSKQALQRLPSYLNYLNWAKKENIKNISSPTIASDLRLNEVQVRKDLAAISSTGGKPRLGYDVDTLIGDIKNFLGYDETDKAVLIGAGQLGRALLSYNGYADYGLEIVAAFDVNKDIIGKRFKGKPIYHVNKLYDVCKKNNIHIGIITVSANEAQDACDMLVECGILAIWNFAPSHLVVPDNILVQHENTAASLALLSMHLREKMDKDK
ncbi:redox-sensing transcriptional repressor Rex [Anaerofustis butyriciformans]|uniref:redox-sensing transcriptional repressor Rex n=1 Tax=Anaerofustis butyriciformans TaxID=3108533 RepID=UPI002E2FBF87|nr:redox-sensing transcriptional repressor Rex [Anaerofustis sp. HA2171]